MSPLHRQVHRLCVPKELALHDPARCYSVFLSEQWPMLQLDPHEPRNTVPKYTKQKLESVLGSRSEVP